MSTNIEQSKTRNADQLPVRNYTSYMFAKQHVQLQIVLETSTVHTHTQTDCPK